MAALETLDLIFRKIKSLTPYSNTTFIFFKLKS